MKIVKRTDLLRKLLAPKRENLKEATRKMHDQSIICILHKTSKDQIKDGQI
jgi:hypothetical protein